MAGRGAPRRGAAVAERGRQAFTFTFTDPEIEALGRGEPIVRDGVLGPAAVTAARDAAVRMMASGELAAAGMGRGAAHRLDGLVRGDRIAWLEADDVPPDLAAARGLFGAVREAANEAAWLGLRRYDVQVACYPGDGVGYARHVDAFSGPANRRLTAIWYLNPGWGPEDGGLLRVFGPGGVREVEPLADRLVVFLSDRVEHEVLPVHVPRFTATAWFYAAP